MIPRFTTASRIIALASIFLASVGTGTSIVMNETNNQGEFEQWLAEKVYESRQPMHDVYYRIFSTLILKGDYVPTANSLAIDLVKKTFGVHEYSPPTLTEADDWF